MTIKSLYPNVRPTLNLNFAQTKALDPRITFTRASTATFVGSNGLIQTAASGAARFDHNPATGESLGLLVEEARTNVLKYSTDFSQAGSWQFSQATPTYNASTAPDGTQTATRLTTATTTSTQYITSTGTNTVAAGTQTVSAYVKPGTCTQLQLQFNGNINTRICFDLATDSTFNIQANGSNGIGTIANVGNGWKRITLTSTVAATDTVAIYLLQNQGFQLSSGLTLEVWGFQAETGSFPTSYIPTTSATVTRAADVASMTGTNFSSWYNQTQGTLVATTPSGIMTTASANQGYFGISTGTLAASLSTGDGIKYGNGSPPTYTRFQVIAASVTQVDTNSATNAPKIAFAYATNDFALVRGGSLFTDTSGNVPTGMDTFTIRGIGSQSYSRMAYYPVRLPDAQLQALTAT